MAQAYRDENNVPTLIASSNVDGFTPVRVFADPVTHRLLVDLAGGSGSVTSVSVVTANGFAGTVANATTTPAITLSTTITGLVKGNGTAISAASAGTDYTNLAFKTWSVSGQSDVVADSAEDTMTFVAGTNMTITTNASTDTITFNAAGGSGSPGGADTNIQFNDSSSFGGQASFSFDKASNVVTLGAEASGSAIKAPDATTTNADGGSIAIFAGSPNGSGAEGSAGIFSSGLGNNFFAVEQGFGASLSSNGGSGQAIFSTASLTTNRTFTFPDSSGTLALTGGSSGITIGTTTITSGTTTRILYDNAGVVGEYTITGTGTVVAMQTAPTFVTSITAPLIIGGSGTTGTQLTLQTTTGNGTTDALVVKGGNNGATTFATFTIGALTITTSGVFTTGTIELGAASDTTLSRSSAGVLAVEGVVIPSISSTNTITNKRIEPRIVSTASYTTDTGTSLTVATTDQFVITAQAGALKFNNPGGTPVNGENIIIRIKDDGTARALTYDTQFRASSDLALPSTTVLSKTLYMGFIFNSTDTTWDLLAVLNNF